MTRLEYAQYLGGVVTNEFEEECYPVQHCCAEMEALIEWCNGMVEMFTPEEWEAWMFLADSTHVDIRREIREHRCERT